MTAIRSAAGSTLVEQHHMRSRERRAWDRNITLGNSFTGKTPSLERSPLTFPKLSSYRVCLSSLLLLCSLQRLLKVVVTLQRKSLSPDPPFCGPAVPMQCACLLMPSQDSGGGGGFMNGAIWEAGNTANVKIDVWVGSFRVADKGMEVPFQRADSSS